MQLYCCFLLNFYLFSCFFLTKISISFLSKTNIDFFFGANPLTFLCSLIIRTLEISSHNIYFLYYFNSNILSTLYIKSIISGTIPPGSSFTVIR